MKKTITKLFNENRQRKAKLFALLTVLTLIVAISFDYFALYSVVPHLLILCTINEILTFSFIVGEIISQRRDEETEN